MKRALYLASLFLWMMALGACSSSQVYRPSGGAGFVMDPGADINDADIRAAFEARPQMAEGLNVAYYSLDPERVEEIQGMLGGVANVERVYRIPNLLVNGQRRFEDPWRVPERSQVSLKKLRLLAARARCDVLLIFDHGYRIDTSPNGWMALNALLLPVLFTPAIDESATSYLDVYVMDTRNGYLYAHLSADESSEAPHQTIWSTESQEMVERHWAQLLKQSGQHLAQTIEHYTTAKTQHSAAAP